MPSSTSPRPLSEEQLGWEDPYDLRHRATPARTPAPPPMDDDPAIVAVHDVYGAIREGDVLQFVDEDDD